MLCRILPMLDRSRPPEGRKSESTEGVGGAEPGRSTKQAAYAPGEEGTAGRKGGQESFPFGWLFFVKKYL